MAVVICLGLLSAFLIWNRCRKFRGSEKFEKRLKMGLFLIGLAMCLTFVVGVTYVVHLMATTLS
jgi:Na+/pantothenate symporter